MSTLAVELHDVAALALAAGEDSPRAAVAGVVRLDGGRLLVGEAALDGARFLPRQVHGRFWHELSLEPLGDPFPPGWRAADLAHAHLEELWRRAGQGVQDVLVAAPGILEGERLGLALGVARSLGLPVTGAVDAALAAAVHAAETLGEIGDGSWLHLDLLRHAAVATRLVLEDGELVVARRKVEDGLGREAFFADWAQAASRAFVRTTRFDPLGQARDEQQLVDRLPGWLETLESSPSVDARLETEDGEVASIELDRGELLEATRPRLERLARLVTGGQGILLSAHAAPLGVEDALRARGASTRRLAPDAACRGALAHRRHLVPAEGPLIHIQRLPISPDRHE